MRASISRWLLATAVTFVVVHRAPAAPPHDELTIALSADEWQRVDRSVDRALAWLAANQDEDGSFPTIPIGQPAVTSLAVMAFLADGHQPGAGPYGEPLNRAIDFVLNCQQPSGIFSFVSPEPHHIHLRSSHAASYNHAIAGLMLTEAYGQVTPGRSERIAAAIHDALRVTLRLQVDPMKANAEDRGGWRYLWKPGAHTPSDSDLSVTGWHLMFLRSAKNAQFEIPDAAVSDAVGYVKRCYDPQQRGFVYGLFGPDRLITRSTMGIGALSLALGGEHQTIQARRAGDWLLEHPFDTYGATMSRVDRFHYGAYYCSNAMAQLGGKYWSEFFPPLAKTLVENQSADGSWPAETHQDAIFGTAYPTALTVLTLTPAYQLLPIYQR
jgi:hypothetical protein